MAKFTENLNLPESTASESVTHALEVGRGKKTHAEPTREEAARRMETGETQGVKGLHRRRINLSLPGDNFRFVEVMSRAAGQTKTAYINALIEAERKRNGKLYNDIMDTFRENGIDAEGD